MAKVWPVYEGGRPTEGEAWASLPLSEAIELFELRPNDFVSDPDTTPRFGPLERDLTFVGFKHIVVEVEPSEGRKARWKPGFYRSRVEPTDAFGRLIQQALASKLGKDNVIRVDWESAIDSQGRDALKIVVVIPAQATQKLRSGVTLDALVSLRERLGHMREERTPIVEYTTEAELAQDVGP